MNAIYGSTMGLSSAGNEFWTQGSPGIKDGVEAEDQFGNAEAR